MKDLNSLQLPNVLNNLDRPTIVAIHVTGIIMKKNTKYFNFIARLPYGHDDIVSKINNCKNQEDKFYIFQNKLKFTDLN